MGRRSTRRPRAAVKDTEAADLKMVLKLSAQEAAAASGSQPESPSVSEVSNNDSDDDAGNKSGNKRSKKSHASTPASKLAKKDDQVLSEVDEHAALVPPDRNLRDRYKPPSPRPQSTSLYDTLVYFQKLMERKDNQHFFATPINDLIAPGYSKIIKQPMDLSTTRDCIEKKLYKNIMEYKADIKLICVNAMTYNHPDTIYYKAAQKLLEYAMRTMSKDRLLSLRKNNPLMSGLLDSELALDVDVDASDYIAPSHTQKKKKDSNAYLTFEPVPDHLPAKDIIAIAKEKAAEAAEYLARTQPNSKMGFLRMSEDGTTTLNILNPDHSAVISEKERIITIGDKAGKLRDGRSYLESLDVDDESTEAKTIRYLDYGPYSSSAPMYDSSFASLSKKESDLLLSFYGTQNSLDYIQSLRTFVADSSDALIKMIENLLDDRTGGKHTQALTQLKELREKESEELRASLSSEEKAPVATEGQQDGCSQVDFESLKSLQDLGIDVSFVDHFKMEAGNEIQQQLDNIAASVNDLQSLQNNRLSQPPGSEKVKNIPDEELSASTNLSGRLACIAKQAKPGEITDTAGIHKALGVGMATTEAKSNADRVDDLMNGKTSTPIVTDPIDHRISLDKSPTEIN